MAWIEGAEHPIRHEPVSGPAIDRWNSLKEENNNERFSSVKLGASYAAYKSDVFDGLDVMIRAMGGVTEPR